MAYSIPPSFLFSVIPPYKLEFWQVFDKTLGSLNNRFTLSNNSSILLSPSLTIHGIPFAAHSSFTCLANKMSRFIQLSKACRLSEHPSKIYGTHSRSL